MQAIQIIPVLLALGLGPLLLGIINRVKALWGGRTGPPLIQPYRDIRKLLAKSALYSNSTTWVVKASPILALASSVAVIALVPLGGIAAPLSFQGDIILVAYIFAIGRFFTILGALDTASPFCGMGGVREAFYGALVEVIFFFCIITLSVQVHSVSFTDMLSPASNYAFAPTILVVGCMFVVVLAENARIPVDDPCTHLELTMIHEVMILDHGGPDLGIIEYGSAIKLWVFSAILSQLFMPISATNSLVVNLGWSVLGVFLIAIAIGAVECGMARLKFLYVPRLLVGAAAISAFAIILAAMG